VKDMEGIGCAIFKKFVPISAYRLRHAVKILSVCSRIQAENQTRDLLSMKK
jgi:hypothetical protein